MNRRYSRMFLFLATILLLILFSGSLQQTSPDQASASDMAPGLAVRFFDKKFNSLEQMPAGGELDSLGRTGEPVVEINHHYDKDGNVFGSGRSQNVGVYFSGIIKLPQAGVYSFQALSNDGVRCLIEDQVLFEDPLIHGDRLTPVGTFHAAAPGWYSIKLIYFQKKGSAALKFYWKPPGAEKFDIVPAAVLAHYAR